MPWDLEFRNTNASRTLVAHNPKARMFVESTHDSPLGRHIRVLAEQSTPIYECRGDIHHLIGICNGVWTQLNAKVALTSDGPYIYIYVHRIDDDLVVWFSYNWTFYAQTDDKREAQLQLAARVLEEVFAPRWVSMDGGFFQRKWWFVYVRGVNSRPVHWDILERMRTKHECYLVGVIDTHSPDSLDALFEGKITPKTDVCEVHIFVDHCASNIRVRPPAQASRLYKLGIFSSDGGELPEDCAGFAKELSDALGVQGSNWRTSNGNLPF